MRASASAIARDFGERKRVYGLEGYKGKETSEETGMNGVDLFGGRRQEGK